MKDLEAIIDLLTTRDGLQRLAGITLIAVFATCVLLAAESAL